MFFFSHPLPRRSSGPVKLKRNRVNAITQTQPLRSGCYTLTDTPLAVGRGHESLFTNAIIRAVGVYAVTVLTNVRIASFAFVFVVAHVRHLIMHSTLGTHALERSHGVYTRSALTNTRYRLALVYVWKTNRNISYDFNIVSIIFLIPGCGRIVSVKCRVPND